MNTRSKSDDFALLAALCQLKQRPNAPERTESICVTRISVLKLNLPVGLALDRRITSAVLFDGLQTRPAVTRWSVYAIDPDLVAEIGATLLGRARRHRATLLQFGMKKLLHGDPQPFRQIASVAAIATSFSVLYPADGDQP